MPAVRQIWRYLRTGLVITCALLSVAMYLLMVRSRTISDKAQRSHSWIDESGAARSTYFGLWSGHDYIWFTLDRDRLGSKGRGSWMNDYFVEARRSGGRAVWQFSSNNNLHEYFLIDPFEGMTHRGPVRWGIWPRAKPELDFTSHGMRVAVDHRLLAILFAIPPAYVLLKLAIRWQRLRWRRNRSLCIRCGYDLRATREKCPECGYGPVIDSTADPVDRSTHSSTIPR